MHHAAVVVVNSLISFVVHLYASEYLLGVTQANADTIRMLPSWLVCFPVMVGVGEIWFYYVHRLAHHRAVYSYVHKWHHEFRTTHPLAASYNHPLEHVLLNVPAAWLGPFVLAMVAPSLLRFEVIAAYHITALFHLCVSPCVGKKKKKIIIIIIIYSCSKDTVAIPSRRFLARSPGCCAVTCIMRFIISSSNATTATSPCWTTSTAPSTRPWPTSTNT